MDTNLFMLLGKSEVLTYFIDFIDIHIFVMSWKRLSDVRLNTVFNEFDFKKMYFVGIHHKIEEKEKTLNFFSSYSNMQ